MGILLAIHVLVTIFLILIVLVQKNEGGSSLFASSGSGGMFNARGTSNILTKTTWVLASIFLINCVLMAAIESAKIKEVQTVIENKQPTSAPVPNDPEG
ncbi:MAG: preprotein translocase subunit SecG [Holosporales bacterium]|jgi:preprotein translocase subunit SecG|nr:preprotein translocase subunit SecG [Holosporales bacterium]